MFDTTIQPIDTTLNVPSEESIQAAKEGGPPVNLELQLLMGILLPLGQNGQPVGAPYGVLRVPLNKEGAISLGKALLESAENLPDTVRSDLAVASSMADVNKVAAGLGQFS